MSSVYALGNVAQSELNEIRVNKLIMNDMEAYACRAWVNFNGTGTVAIRASGNVSSITDNGTGNYTVNFTTAMPDANYAQTVLVEPSLSSVVPIGGGSHRQGNKLTTSTNFATVNNTDTAFADFLSVSLAIFR